MAVNAFLMGLQDTRLVEHLLTQGPKTLPDAERIAIEFFQLRRSLAAPQNENSRNRNGRRDNRPAFFAGPQSPADDPSFEYSCQKNLHYSDASLFEASLVVEPKKRQFKKPFSPRSRSSDVRRPPAGLMSSSQARPKSPPAIPNRDGSPG